MDLREGSEPLGVGDLCLLRKETGTRPIHAIMLTAYRHGSLRQARRRTVREYGGEKDFTTSDKIRLSHVYNNFLTEFAWLRAHDMFCLVLLQGGKVGGVDYQSQAHEPANSNQAEDKRSQPTIPLRRLRYAEDVAVRERIMALVVERLKPGIVPLYNHFE